MHTKFGINYEGHPKALSKEEYIFRISMMMEELLEYTTAVFEVPDQLTNLTTAMNEFREIMAEFPLKESQDLEAQFDALVDLSVFVKGTCELQGFPYAKGFQEVMAANMRKRRAASSNESKRNLEFDLIKPTDWESPDLKQLVYPTGVIVLDGPDGAGKTVLANKLAARYNGVVIHHTWSEELETRWYGYFEDTIKDVFEADQLVIIDRLYLSQWIYHKAFRSDREDTWGESMKLIKGMIRELNGLEIICIPSDKQAYLSHYDELSEQREEMYDTMSAVYDGYMHYTLDETYEVYDLFEHWETTDKYVENIGAQLKW